jgi:regulator-associated protein of mTOR
VWLEFGTESKKPPEQLPIVLQVLLSQQHRQRALDLLAQFIDLGMLSSLVLSRLVAVTSFILDLWMKEKRVFVIAI